MHEILIVGNPNVGKSTLFNSLTKSSEHTGNFHGVTVEAKAKEVIFNGNNYRFIDLPGMYSLNSFSYEESVSKNILLTGNGQVLILVDANSLKKNLYLCLQLSELGIPYKIVINNYDYFTRAGNKIDIEKLKSKIKSGSIINAKKIKLNEELLNFEQTTDISCNYIDEILSPIEKELNKTKNDILRAIYNDYKGLLPEEINKLKKINEELVQNRYKAIDDLLNDCVYVKPNFVYGYNNKVDKLLLNPLLSITLFFLLFFTSLYCIFFFLGPILSDFLNDFSQSLFIKPIMNLLYLSTDNVWLIDFFDSGVFSAFSTVFAFLPQVALMFIFLTILEDSGIISRLAFVLDDFLTNFGLNGKAIYIILLGFGCNTMSTVASRNLPDKNMRTKTAILNPYISCMARLPIFSIIASAFFGKNAFFVIAGLYLLGIIVMLIVAKVLDKKLLPTKNDIFLLEFAPLRAIDIKHILKVGLLNAWDMIKRIFGVVLSVSVIVWILTHTRFDLSYTQNFVDSILFIIADKLTFIFAPIGLNQAGVICALMVGIMAKELIVSTFAICNKATNNQELIKSLLGGGIITFNINTAIAFLIFCLLYSSCASNYAVIRQETSKFNMYFVAISQFVVAYLLTFVVYQFMKFGIWIGFVILFVITIIISSILFIIKKAKKDKLTCMFCNKCK